MMTFGLPSARRGGWRTAPRFGSGEPTQYLPLGARLTSATGRRLDWLTSANKIVMLPDGFPGRLRNGQLVIHPLDGRYLLDALLAEQAERPRRRLRDAIARTAAAMVGRAESLGDALVMRYVDTASSMAEGRPHISALAQAYYATSLSRAATYLGDRRLQRHADRFFAALTLPVSDGGALDVVGHDTSFALVPTRPRDLVLNGWLSTLVSLNDYAALRSSGEARDLFRSSVRTLLRLLPSYDVPDLHLSRYGLTGPLLLRIALEGPDPASVRLMRLRVAIPGEGDIAIRSRSGGRWTARTYPEDAAARPSGPDAETLFPRGRGLRLVAVLSRAPYPRPNRLRFHVRTPEPLSIHLTAHIGRYDPLTSATVDRSWVPLATARVGSGSHDVDLEIPYEPVHLFAYPTNFTRGGPDRKLNSYHGTHIVRLRTLADVSGHVELREWADLWLRYVRLWRRHRRYADGVCWTPEGEVGG